MSLKDMRNEPWFQELDGATVKVMSDWVSTTGENALKPLADGHGVEVRPGGEVVLPFPSQNIVELGGGDKPAFHPNVDIRKLPTVDIVKNLEEDFSDIGKFDGIWGNYVLEHISWRHVKTFIKSCYNILSDGGCAIFVVPNTYEQIEMMVKKGSVDLADSCTLFGGQDFTDNCHKWLLSPRLIKELFTEAGFSKVECYDHPNLACWDMFIFAYRGITPLVSRSVPSDRSDLNCINFGSFTVTFPKPWVNVDIRGDIKPLVESKGHLFVEHDVRTKLPWDDDSVDYIAHHHLLEHLTDEEGVFFLKECCRVLKPNGVMRFSVPDAMRLAGLYYNENMSVLENESDEVKNAKHQVDAFWTLLTSGHKTMYDETKLYEVLHESGFIGYKTGHCNSDYEIFINTIELFPEHSIFMEAKKTEGVNISTGVVSDYKAYLEG